MVAFALAGVVCLALQGFPATLFLVAGRLFKEWGWPYFRICALVQVLTTLGLALVMGLAKMPPLPDKLQRKWVFLRGVFGTVAFLLQILAVRVGGQPGDVASLSSVNTVAAALFGRVFLGEALRPLHGISLTCTISGATLIAQPEFLSFDTSSSPRSSSTVGLILAALSGFCYAASFVCSRKAATTSPLHLATCAAIFSAVGFAVLPFCPWVDDFSWSIPATSLALWFGVLLPVNVAGWFFLSAGAKWCPAALSSTTNLTSRMVVGYSAQAMFFGAVPSGLTIGGAILMLAGVGVVVFATVDKLPRKSIDATTTEGACAVLPNTQESSPPIEFDDSSDLSTFVASECGDVRGSCERELRHRLSQDESKEAPQSIGAGL
eukprot:TRINITY_DN18610_c0_g1_i1.p1 TRINITY_DN18610_c0_g1~~TRINITY_DN18610_c0_g1_i1.p1  ORF type:complete len:378 (+),score=48.25 TRINITY_DN18610_c0_g1_i1:77-1210(+)